MMILCTFNHVKRKDFYMQAKLRYSFGFHVCIKVLTINDVSLLLQS